MKVSRLSLFWIYYDKRSEMKFTNNRNNLGWGSVKRCDWLTKLRCLDSRMFLLVSKCDIQTLTRMVFLISDVKSQLLEGANRSKEPLCLLYSLMYSEFENRRTKQKRLLWGSSIEQRTGEHPPDTSPVQVSWMRSSWVQTHPPDESLSAYLKFDEFAAFHQLSI